MKINISYKSLFLDGLGKSLDPLINENSLSNFFTSPFHFSNPYPKK